MLESFFELDNNSYTRPSTQN